MTPHVLLLEDVEDLGRKGEIVRVKPGFARNFLLPQKKAVVATERTKRQQSKLQEERAKQAVEDRKDAEVLAGRLQDQLFTKTVKVDPEGHLYGSVSAQDIVLLITEAGYPVERKSVVLAHPLKTTGVHPLLLKLKEGVTVSCKLQIVAEETAV